MKLRGYAFIEYMIALAVLLIVGTYALRIIYGQQIRAWEAATFGPYRYFVIVPLFALLLFLYWRRSVRDAEELGQPVVRSWVWAVAGIGLLLACAGLATA